MKNIKQIKQWTYESTQELIKLCGGHTIVARETGYSRQGLYGLNFIPIDIVETIARLSGKTKQYIRPDVYNVIKVTCKKCGANQKVNE